MICQRLTSLRLPNLLIIFAGILWLSGLNGGKLQAQPFEGNPIRPPSLPELTPTQPVPLPETPLKIPSFNPNAVEEFPANIPGTIIVKQFQFQGNTAFSTEELAQATQQFTGRPVTFAELLQARSAITKLYVDNGYVTSGSYIPPQTIENGIVTINIVEGKLEDIKVTVEGKLNPNYVRDRLALAGETPLNINRLVEGLQLLQLNPIIEKISAELTASPRPGNNLLIVNVVTARSFFPTAIIDDGRNPQVGEIRRGFNLSEKNLTGNGDKVELTYFNTDGSDDVEVTYQVPVNVYNGTVQVGFRNLTGEIIEQPLDILEINSDYQKYSFKFRQPIIETPNQQFTLELDLDHQQSKTLYLQGLPFPGRGSDNNGRTNISTVRFAQEWVGRSDQQVLSARSEFDWGIEALGTTKPFDIEVNSESPYSNYFLWRGQAQWVRLLAPDTLFLIRSDFQISDRPIISLEQFSLGGLGNVEGYRQNSLLTDNGIFAGMEVRLPIYRITKDKVLVQIIPFFNYGQGWNSGNTPDPQINELASVGVGLQLQYGSLFNARIDWANRLGKELFQGGNSLQDDGIFFTITISP
ncbi:ShlB/FhaC/HecB family hemolysin secretion/activation protein [Crocosphaera sp. XPORK-15E]|uniref:ShlB/FhaC/HecB family hemolysin secretion/activation protein n=1 Tax=Crocosphaera sp. XPORK-15E TaxID=3110247 RepID=UPI002B210FDD|nr:ShlB/FhaC/HecB family hemolysin secretion/activation protein [Crocosphaera sp. XPORK-15E]MEA5536238.1 ShlB/FhaC/HecB family hemolysin secretion/activation protein [Crocosphaera sp. XPORK-15E]